MKTQSDTDEMKLAVVAYPSLDQDDRQWIDSFRTSHDPQAGIGVHVTLMFPVFQNISSLSYSMNGRYSLAT